MVNAASPKGPETPSQAAIGRALGLSKAAVTKCKKLGMPVSSVEAARAWRDANLCFDGRRVELSPGRPRSEPSLENCIERVRALIPAALAAVKAGCFARVEAELRSALRAVPASHDDEIFLPGELWDALTADVQRAVDACRDELGDRVPDTEMPDDEYEVQWMGCFWIAVARGLIRAT